MSSPNIQFAEIGSGIRKPGTYSEFNLSAAKVALPPNEEKILVIAQRIKEPSVWQGTTSYSLGDVVRPSAANGHYYICTVAGTSDSGEPTWPVTATGTVTDATATWMEYVSSGSLVAALTPKRIYSDSEAALYAGAGSFAHLMVQAAFSANNQAHVTLVTVDDDNAAVKASGSFAFSGTATSAGTWTGYIGNVRIAVAITNTQAAATIATNVAAAINAKKHLLPVTADVNSGTVTVRAKNGGTQGNQIPVESASLTATGISCVVTGMASGATDPDLGATSGVLDTVLPGDYTIYVSGLNDADNLGDLKDHLDVISGPLEKRPAIGVFGYTDKTGLISAVKTLCGPTLNHWRLTCGYLPKTRSLPCEVAGAYAAVLASVSDPAGLFNDLPLTGINPPTESDRLTRAQQEDLLDYGVTPLYVIPGEKVAVVRAITTYITNAQGVADPTRLDISVPRSLDYVGKACRSRISIRFPRPKKTAAFKKNLKSELLGVLYETEGLEITENTDTWKDYLIVEDDSQDTTRVNARVPADIVEGAHVLAMRIDLL